VSILSSCIEELVGELLLISNVLTDSAAKGEAVGTTGSTSVMLFENGRNAAMSGLCAPYTMSSTSKGLSDGIGARERCVSFMGVCV
jgi:hypothetical protein